MLGAAGAATLATARFSPAGAQTPSGSQGAPGGRVIDNVFLDRRAAAFQAYYEHMPPRRSSMPAGIDMQLYRRLTFGDLVDVRVLDTRQYRSDQDQARRLDPSRTILGDDQERWLMANLAGGTARWNARPAGLLLPARLPPAPTSASATTPRTTTSLSATGSGTTSPPSAPPTPWC